ncbi:MAG: CapA family protein [Polyangiaceae bacterium]|nr:CapA family protein [Polyangiaceae bacterium]
MARPTPRRRPGALALVLQLSALSALAALACSSRHDREGGAAAEGAPGALPVVERGPAPPDARALGHAPDERAATGQVTPASLPAGGAAAVEIRVSAVGDCALGDIRQGSGAPGTFSAKIRELGEDLAYPFSAVAPIFAEDDLTIANLEGTLTRETRHQNPVFAVRGKPEYAGMLRLGGVELVNLANNHSGDYGPSGYAETERALETAGVGHFGNGRVDRRRVKGVDVVNIGYLGGPKGTREAVVRDIQREKQQGGIVIVSFHWGIETYEQAAPDQIRLGRAAIDAGADLVLGHHPHVLQGIETYRGRHIAYSLGNFVFGANGKPGDLDSIVYQERFVVRDGKVTSVESSHLPVRISGDPRANDFRPVLLEGDEAERVRQKVAKRSAALRAKR